MMTSPLFGCNSPVNSFVKVVFPTAKTHGQFKAIEKDPYKRKNKSDGMLEVSLKLFYATTNPVFVRLHTSICTCKTDQHNHFDQEK